MDEILEYLKAAQTYYFATVDEQGDPQVRPFGTIAKVDGALYIQTGMRKDVFAQVKAHPRGAISAMGPDGTWIRVEADFIPDDSVSVNDAVLADYPELREMYTPGDGNCVCLRMDNIHGTISSFTAAPRELL